MKEEKVRYTLAEELINSISHGIGAALGIAALVITVVISSIHSNPLAIICSIIYTLSIIVLYVMSCIYHALKPNKAKRVFRIIDHCSIFLLIAGSYTPFALLVLKGTTGIILMIAVWLITIIGIVLNSINLEKFKHLSMVLYLFEGWIILFAINPLVKAMPHYALVLLITGGIVYTIGAVIFALGKNIKYMHSVWHFFVLGGTIFQFFSILPIL